MSGLTERQQRTLARNGFVVATDAVDDDLIAEARGALKAAESVTVDENQNEPAGARDVFRAINRQLFAYVDDLIGGEKLKHPDDPNFGTYSDEQARVYVRSPGSGRIDDPEASGDRKVGVHVDDQTDGDGGLCLLAVGLYLDDVAPRNGGFTVWPGSHWMTAAHGQLGEPNTDAEPGTRARAPDLEVRPESPFESMGELCAKMEPYEIAGDAGAAIFWHPGLVHASGVHREPGDLRVTAFSRFHAKPGTWEPADVQHPFTHWDGLDPDLYADVAEPPA